MAKRPTKELYHSPELSLLSQSGHVLQTLAAHILLSLHETSLFQILGHRKSPRPPLGLISSIRPKLKSTVSLLWDPNSYTAQQTMRNPPGPLSGCLSPAFTTTSPRPAWTFGSHKSSPWTGSTWVLPFYRAGGSGAVAALSENTALTSILAPGGKVFY